MLLEKIQQKIATLQFFRKHEKGIIPLREIKKLLPNAPVIIEAGAHVGCDTVAMAKEWPQSTIYAFEPVPSLYGKLLNNTQYYNNICCFPFALGSHNGNQRLFLSSGASDGSSSLLRAKEHLIFHPDVTFDETIDVQVITLDTWFETNGIHSVDFLWLDLQGAELLVLQSGAKVLQSVSCIYTEVNQHENYEGASLYSELRLWLEHNGFRVKKEAVAWEDAGNVLFIRM